MKRAIIFDMDGTLVDSSVTIVNAINYVREKLNLPPLETNTILEKVNDPKLNPAQYFYEVPAFTPQHEAWFSNYYTQNHERELQLYDGVTELLKTLKEKGFRLAIATNSYRSSTIESLSHLNIIDYFESLACYDDVGRGKPAPDMLEKNLKDLKLNAEDTLFVGDSERDLLASQSANIDYIMINWGFSDYKDAIHNIDALKQAILKA
jgi:phosphoglycolate phosphatase